MVGVFLWASSIRKVTQWVCCVRYIRTCIHTYVHMYVRMSECTWNYVRTYAVLSCHSGADCCCQVWNDLSKETDACKKAVDEEIKRYVLYIRMYM